MHRSKYAKDKQQALQPNTDQMKKKVTKLEISEISLEFIALNHA